MKSRLERYKLQLSQSVAHRKQEGSHRVALAIRQLDALSPLKIMQRGYSLVYADEEQKLIKSIAQVELGDRVTIRLQDGKIICQVKSMEEEATDHGGERN